MSKELKNTIISLLLSGLSISLIITGLSIVGHNPNFNHKELMFAGIMLLFTSIFCSCKLISQKADSKSIIFFSDMQSITGLVAVVFILFSLFL